MCHIVGVRGHQAQGGSFFFGLGGCSLAAGSSRPAAQDWFRPAIAWIPTSPAGDYRLRRAIRCRKAARFPRTAVVSVKISNSFSASSELATPASTPAGPQRPGRAKPAVGRIPPLTHFLGIWLCPATIRSGHRGLGCMTCAHPFASCHRKGCYVAPLPRAVRKFAQQFADESSAALRALPSGPQSTRSPSSLSARLQGNLGDGLRRFHQHHSPPELDGSHYHAGRRALRASRFHGFRHTGGLTSAQIAVGAGHRKTVVRFPPFRPRYQYHSRRVADGTQSRVWSSACKGES